MRLLSKFVTTLCRVPFVKLGITRCEDVNVGAQMLRNEIESKQQGLIFPIIVLFSICNARERQFVLMLYRTNEVHV